MIDEVTKARLVAMVRAELDSIDLITNGANSKLAEDDDDYFRTCCSWESRCGATKIVLFPPNEDYIIKIPINGYTMCKDDYIEHWCDKHNVELGLYECDSQGYYDIMDAIDEDYCTGIDTFDYYTGAANSENGWDYCLTEVELSKHAINAGLDDFFACTELLFYYYGYPIYVQPKCVIEYDQDDFAVSEEERRKSNAALIDCYRSGLGIDWLARALKFYGEKAVKRFLGFLEANHIGDLHNENRGLFHNRPVLVDYSGYNG